MKVYIYTDEMYPFHYITSEPYGDPCEWPEDLNYEDYVETMDRFYAWQDKLMKIYKAVNK